MRICAAIAAAALFVAPTAAQAAAPLAGQWRASSPSAPGDHVDFRVQAGQAGVFALNSYVFEPAVDFCVWGGSLFGAPLGVSGPAPVAPDGSFAWTAQQDAFGARAAETHGRFTSPTSVELAVTLSGCDFGRGPVTVQFSGALSDADVRGRQDCRALRLDQGGLLGLGAAAAARRSAKPTAFRIRTRGGLSCDQTALALGGVLGGRDESLGLGAAGFSVARVRTVRVDDRRAYEVTAERDRERLLYTRYGRPRIDHSLWRAGQHILVSQRLDVDGRRYWSPCTGAFALAFPGLPAGASTAGHCTDESLPAGDPIPVQRGYSGLPKPVTIGNVIARAGTAKEGVDAAAFSLFVELGVMQEIERGESWPLTVTGSVPTGEQTRGLRICFAGASSGADQCGQITERFGGAPAQTLCTDIETRPGDSGGPVYTDPGRGLRVRAVGIVSTRKQYGFHRMCYLPIDVAATAMGATVPVGPIVRAPGAGFPR